MNLRLITSALVLLSAVSASLAADAPAAPPKTGEMELTFSQRSPLSSHKELTRRLNLDQFSVPADYDLSQCLYWVYVPKNYDPATPYGIFVYLGYKDSTSTPSPWHAALDQAHMIFITPVCHTGNGVKYLPEVPMTQTLGLALDGVDNLKRLYNIDPRRIYFMSWYPHGMQMAFATTDVFTGFVLVEDHNYFAKLLAANGSYYDANFPPPPRNLMEKSSSRGFYFIDGDDADAATLDGDRIRQTAMKQYIRNVSLTQLSLLGDLHYPNPTADWFAQKALPFLDAAAADQTPFKPVYPTEGAAVTDAPAAADATAAPGTTAPTGEIDLTFTQRSPLSTKKELARRLSIKESAMGEDYDLPKMPYKAYVPTNYNAATPQGIFVYLGYKDTTSTPPLWQPFLEETHMIFISPVCHSGKIDPPFVPQWQSMGLAYDAVDNLKHLYNIDPKRIYLMSWDDGSAQMSFNSADVFTGFIVTFDSSFFARLTMKTGTYYPPQFPTPDTALYTKAKSRGFFLVSDQGNANLWQEESLRLAVMKQTFKHVSLNSLSLDDDLHYPNFKLEWLSQKAIPFLDAAAADPAAARLNLSSAAATAPTANAPSAPAPSPAGHLLSMATLYVKNGQTDLARAKLQQITTQYPNDPAAVTAKQMIQQLDNPQ